MKRVSTIGLAVTWALVACEPISEPDSQLPADLSLQMSPVVQSVTGSGHLVSLGWRRTFTDVAYKLADGTVDGQWERVTHAGPNAWNKSHGVITCFRIINGNQAWLGGYATSGEYSTPPNNEVGWFVIDKGQGANADPDVIGLQWVGQEPGFAENLCETGAAIPPWPSFPYWSPITDGNIRVRP